jgi:hypothetical protein
MVTKVLYVEIYTVHNNKPVKMTAGSFLLHSLFYKNYFRYSPFLKLFLLKTFSQR